MKAKDGDSDTKRDFQVILHAVEELYFQGSFRAALDIVEESLKANGEDGRKVLDGYRERCLRRIEREGEGR